MNAWLKIYEGEGQSMSEVHGEGRFEVRSRSRLCIRWALGAQIMEV